MRPIALLFCLVSTAICQSQTTGPATTKGPCSPAITGSGNTINIKTCGTEQGDEFRKLLKTIASNQQLDTATILKKLDDCLQTMANRHLTEAQKTSILAKVSPLPGHKISINIPLGNSEAKSYAMEFVEIFRKARWIGIEDAGVGQSVWDKDPAGIEITVNEADARAGRVPPDAILLLDTFFQLGLVDRRTMFVNSGTPSGDVELRIGTKPPTIH
jgi:hypothetical protein